MFEKNYIVHPWDVIENRTSIEKPLSDYYPKIVTETIEPVKEIKVDEEKKEEGNSRRAIKKGSKRSNKV
jgi:hypothetical protein